MSLFQFENCMRIRFWITSWMGVTRVIVSGEAKLLRNYLRTRLGKSAIYTLKTFVVYSPTICASNVHENERQRLRWTWEIFIVPIFTHLVDHAFKSKRIFLAPSVAWRAMRHEVLLSPKIWLNTIDEECHSDTQTKWNHQQRNRDHFQTYFPLIKIQKLVFPSSKLSSFLVVLQIQLLNFDSWQFHSIIIVINCC